MLQKKIIMYSMLHNYPKTELNMLPKRSFKWWESLLGAVMLAVIGVGMYQYWQLNAKDIHLNDRLAKAQTWSRQAEIKPINLSDAETIALEDVYKKINYSWDRPFKALEKARMPEISILEIQPDVGRLEFNIAAQATSLQTMLDYTKKLREQPFVRRVVLNSKESQEDASQPVLFSVTLTWY